MAITSAPIVTMLREYPIKLIRINVMSKDTGIEEPTIRLPLKSPKNTNKTTIVITTPNISVSNIDLIELIIASALSY